MTSTLCLLFYKYWAWFYRNWGLYACGAGARIRQGILKKGDLHIKVQMELPWVWPKPDPINLRTFVLDPDINDILCEDTPFKQELVICFKRVNCLFE